MSETKKRGFRLNLFDVILILAVIACIAGIALHAYFTRSLTEEYTEIARVRFTVENLSEHSAAAVKKEGAAIYAEKGDHKLGTMGTVSSELYTVAVENEAGTLVSVSHPDRLTVKGEATLIGTWTDDGFLLSGSELLTVGTTIHVYTEYASFLMTVSGISR